MAVGRRRHEAHPFGGAMGPNGGLFALSALLDRMPVIEHCQKPSLFFLLTDENEREDWQLKLRISHVR